MPTLQALESVVIHVHYSTDWQFLTLITLAKVSAPLQVSPQPVKLTDIIDKEFLMALHKTENDKKLKEIL